MDLQPSCQSNTTSNTPSVRPRGGKTVWRSLNEFEGTSEFNAMLEREFPEGADTISPEERRQFVKVMGASFALAGLAITGCRRWPEQKIVPAASRPATRTPGKAVWYSTASEIDGVGTPLLAKSFDGRPIKLDTNTAVSGCATGTTATVQSMILDLYDQDRTRDVMHDGHAVTMVEFQTFAANEFRRLRAQQGKGLAFLFEPASGLATRAQRATIQAAFPQAVVAEWTPRHNDAERAGTTAAFGQPMRPFVRLDEAKVIVALDSDFLMDGQDSARLTGEWAKTRRIESSDATKQELSRLYSFESRLTVTGMNADERVPLRATDVTLVAAAIAKRLGIDGGDLNVRSAIASIAGQGHLPAGTDAVIEALAKDIEQAKGQCVMFAGPSQSAAVHALVALINQNTGAAGRTVSYQASQGPRSFVDSITSLTAALNSGSIETLVIVGANPAYDAPQELAFATAMVKAKNVIRLGYRLEETGSLKACQWHISQAHFLECWGDSLSADGTAMVQQPLILPLVEPEAGGLSEIELLAMILGEGPQAGYDIVRAVYQQRNDLAVSFETAWRTGLDCGQFGTVVQCSSPTVNAANVAALVLLAKVAPATGTELVLFTDSKAFGGYSSNNAWMQELPDPVTKVTWDNALLVAPVTARALGVKDGGVVRVTVGSQSMEAPVFIVPGHPEGTAALATGYGRGIVAGRIADGSGCDAYSVRVGGANVFAGVSLAATGATYPIAHTQDKGIADAIDPSIPLDGIQDRLPSLVREGTLDEYRHHPDFAKHRTHVVHRLSLWEESNLDGAQFRWAMSIDLNSCTGCSACVAACQAENNIPIVGKGMVLRGREMAWIRLDRYFKGRDSDRPVGYLLQPVTCLHCENAPCEQVCPVGATLHDEDGLNVMVYNRCIGTRYCSNNCPYKVRRFNFFDYYARIPERTEGFWKTDLGYYERFLANNRTEGPEVLRQMQFNPEVTVRSRGVMEKCTFCTQRIQEAKIDFKNAWAQAGGEKSGTKNFSIPDGSIVTACQQACPANAIVFGDLNDPKSKVSGLFKTGRSYQMLEEINTKPRLRYLAKVTNPALPRASDGGHDSHEGHNHGASEHTTENHG